VPPHDCPFPPLPFVSGETITTLDRLDEARAAYERALALSSSEPERRFLSARITTVTQDFQRGR
jgi:predicted RNA polymerase sigma factor